MKIAVNARWLLPGKLEGTGVYTLNMLKRIIPAFPQHTFILIYDRSSVEPRDFNASNVHHVIAGPPARHPLLWRLWNNWSVPKVLKRNQVDLYWSPDGLMADTKIPQWVTIHDLNFEHHPEWLKPNVANYYKKNVRKSAELASQLFTVSAWSAEDIANQYDKRLEDIIITPNAPSANASDNIYNPEAYFCAVGALTPRKNIITLVRAFESWLEQYSERRHFRLKIAGSTHLKNTELDREIQQMRFKENIEFLGHVTGKQLDALYSNATAFCMPSAMEGFGIPLIEAMQSGTPVISADNSALTEIVSGAGMLVDTYDVNAWTDALEHMANGGSTWVPLGIQRAEQYNWERSAAVFIDVLKREF